MNLTRKWLQPYAYAAHVAAFLIMLVTPVWMYIAVQQATAAQRAEAWIYPPLALFILANLLELLIQ
jgi:hypothetical protein